MTLLPFRLSEQSVPIAVSIQTPWFFSLDFGGKPIFCAYHCSASIVALSPTFTKGKRETEQCVLYDRCNCLSIDLSNLMQSYEILMCQQKAIDPSDANDNLLSVRDVRSFISHDCEECCSLQVRSNLRSTFRPMTCNISFCTWPLVYLFSFLLIQFFKLESSSPRRYSS